MKWFYSVACHLHRQKDCYIPSECCRVEMLSVYNWHSNGPKIDIGVATPDNTRMECDYVPLTTTLC